MTSPFEPPSHPEMSKQYLNRPIPIVIHGCAYPVPDGRGLLGGWGILPGPWLRPSFHRKGHSDQDTNAKVMRKLTAVMPSQRHCHRYDRAVASRQFVMPVTNAHAVRSGGN